MSDGIHRKFLETLGWTGQELEEFLPDWLNTARFLHLTDEDVRRAVEEWIPAYWNISLSGVRKSIAACIREAADTAKMGAYMREGKKVLYSTMPSCPVCITANKLAGEGRLEISYPYFIVTSILGAFFNKSTDQLFNGSCMDPNCHHCGMNCMRADSVMSGTIPKPTVTWNWGLQCNESPKTDEMIFTLGKAEWDNVLTTIPHDAPLGDSEADDDERVEYLKEEIRVSQEEVTQHTGIEVREEHLRAAVSEYMGYLKRIEHLTDLVMNADPQPLTGNELALMGICMESAFNTGLGWLNDAIDTAIAEVEELIREGRGRASQGRAEAGLPLQPPQHTLDRKDLQGQRREPDPGQDVPPGQLPHPPHRRKRHLHQHGQDVPVRAKHREHARRGQNGHGAAPGLCGRRRALRLFLLRPLDRRA